MKDEGELRMFFLVAEGIEDLLTETIETLVRKAPALRERFAMKEPSHEVMMIDGKSWSLWSSTWNTCLDIHNNVQFSPRLCLWAIDQKLESTGEKLVPDAEFCD